MLLYNICYMQAIVIYRMSHKCSGTIKTPGSPDCPLLYLDEDTWTFDWIDGLPSLQILSEINGQSNLYLALQRGIETASAGHL